MLELQEVSLRLGESPDDPALLAEVSARFPRKHFAAIIGPSGCGKSTLLKVIAGLRESTDGSIAWDGRDLAEEADMDPHEIGYVPQFSIAYELLTVIENLESALRLRVEGSMPKSVKPASTKSFAKSGSKKSRIARCGCFPAGKSAGWRWRWRC